MSAAVTSRDVAILVLSAGVPKKTVEALRECFDVLRPDTPGALAEHWRGTAAGSEVSLRPARRGWTVRCSPTWRRWRSAAFP